MSKPPETKLKTISGTVAARQFGRLIRMAQQEPILITQRGHPRLVVVSVREYQRLTRFQMPVTGPAANDSSCPCVGRAPAATSRSRA